VSGLDEEGVRPLLALVLGGFLIGLAVLLWIVASGNL